MLTVELVVTIVVEFILGMAIAVLAGKERRLLRVLRSLLLGLFALVGVGLIVLIFFGAEPFYALLGRR